MCDTTDAIDATKDRMHLPRCARRWGFKLRAEAGLRLPADGSTGRVGAAIGDALRGFDRIEIAAKTRLGTFEIDEADSHATTSNQGVGGAAQGIIIRGSVPSPSAG